MAEYVKAGTGTNLAATAAWLVNGSTPATLPTASDTCTWVKGSSVGGSLTGNFTTGSITFNGTTAAGSGGGVTHSGTLTLTNGFTFTSTNNVFWTATGTIAVGATTQTWTLHSTEWSAVSLSGTNSLSGAVNSKITLVKGAGAGFGDLYTYHAYANFLGTIEIRDAASLSLAGTVAHLTGANFILGPNLGLISVSGVAETSRTLGSSAKQLTIAGDCLLGADERYLTIAPAVVLQGPSTHTLYIEGDTIFSTSISGTNGLTVVVRGSTGLRPGLNTTNYLQITGTSNGLSGPCSVAGGRFVLSPASTASRYQPSSLNVASDATFEYDAMSSSTNFDFPCAPTGQGYIVTHGNYSAGGGVTYPAGRLSGFAGIVRVACYNTASYSNSRIRLYELPGGVDWWAGASGAGAMTAEVTYLGPEASYNTNLTLDVRYNTDLTALSGGTYSLIVPDTAGPLTITGTVRRLNSAETASARMSLTLGGTNTGNNALTGAISEAASPLNGATLGIIKTGSGRWILSGANTYTQTTNVTQGTLSAQSAGALGAAGASGGDVTVAGGTLDISGGTSVDKTARTLTLSSTGAVALSSTTGVNSIACSSVSLNSTGISIDVASGAQLTVNNTGAIAESGGSRGFTKTGAGTLVLGAATNTFTGQLSVNEGTLAVASAAALSTAPVALATTLGYTGTTATSGSNAINFTSSTPTFEATGSGGITWAGPLSWSAAPTIKLDGTSNAVNSISSALADTAAAPSVQKIGSGTWYLTGALSYSGTTVVSSGTLEVGSSDSNSTTGAVSVQAGATLRLRTDADPATPGSGRVLGTSVVTVSGTLRTHPGAQRGCMRYGGDLTFYSGALLVPGST